MSLGLLLNTLSHMLYPHNITKSDTAATKNEWNFITLIVQK